MRIRLKKNHVQIEIKNSSKYFHKILNAHSNAKCKKKKEQLLKNIYYICAQHANYHNPHFFSKLLQSSNKKIILCVTKDQSLEEHYRLLKSDEKDSLHVIRKRYLQLAKLYHPDRVSYENANLVKEYTHKFQKIQRAYEALRLKNAS